MNFKAILFNPVQSALCPNPPKNVQPISKIHSPHSNIPQRFNPKNSINSKSQIWSKYQLKRSPISPFKYSKSGVGETLDMVHPGAEFLSFHTPVKLGNESVVPLSPHLLSLAPFSIPSFYFKYLHSCFINFLLILKHMLGMNHIVTWLKERQKVE